MNRVTQAYPTMVSHLKLFLALSRTPHGLLDMATPALAALLWLGTIPSLKVTLLGMITAFAGYTAVYALNDVVDFRIDREKMQANPRRVSTTTDLDAVYVRHPLAQGLLPYWQGLAWAAGWAIVALIGAYLLNPVCALLFAAGCLLEIVYCLLLRVTYLRALVSGIVKTIGGVAAIYAVSPSPSLPFVVSIFLWLFAWEIGGQNVPNDWADKEEDEKLQARTIPVHFGVRRASVIILWCLGSTVVLSILLIGLAPVAIAKWSSILIIISGIGLLLIPGYQLYRNRDSQQAAILFNWASYYPLSLFLILAANHLW